MMPRQRRRHHSRSRSRSHSQEKDRDVKRRKVEVYDSPNHKRSVSPKNGPAIEEKDSKILRETQLSEEKKPEVILIDSDSEQSFPVSKSKGSDAALEKSAKSPEEESRVQRIDKFLNRENKPDHIEKFTKSPKEKSKIPRIDKFLIRQNKSDHTPEDVSTVSSRTRKNIDSKTSDVQNIPGDVISFEPTTPVSKNKEKVENEETPSRRITPNQVQKKLESEKKKQQREKEREDREKQKQDEKDKKESEKLKKKEQKQKEIEMKQKEKEEKIKEKEEKEEQRKREKEQKRLEKEKKEEQKRKEKEEEKLKKQLELDEKNKERQKEEEKKQKAAAAFVSFFVPKKVNTTDEKRIDETTLAFMPFEVKSDMKLPLARRKPLTQEEKEGLVKLLLRNDQEVSYLKDLKSTVPRTCPKTWPCQESENDVTVIDEDEVLGETICEEKPKSERMRAKYMKFHENRRPAYYGTWRKKSNNITGRKPFMKELIFDYEVDSDDDWEEEEQGENLEILSDDDKENDPENEDNEDYEVDNEFFVPHGHLSDDEVDDEETSRLSPESQKAKLKLLKDAFDQDIKSKTYKIKPRSIGCIWYDREGKNVDEAINRYLLPLTVITSGQITIKKRDIGNADGNIVRKRKLSTIKDIPENLMPILLRLVHGHTIKRKFLAIEFLNYIHTNNSGIELSKANVSRHINNIARWTKNSGTKRKFCWMVNEDVAEKYSVDLVFPNDWESVKDTLKI